MKIEPLLDRVLIKPGEASQQTESGLVIPAGTDKYKQYGKVAAVSDGVPTGSGSLRKVCVKKGDRVVYNPQDAIEIKDGDKVYNLVQESALYAVLK